VTDADDIRLMFDSKYIGAWDLRGQDVTVTIERIEGGTVEGEKGRKDKAPLCFLKGWPKPFILNKTNTKTIAAMYATHSRKALVGKRITLYATKCSGKAGGEVDCVRIRPTMPDRPGVPQSKVGEVPVDAAMRKRQMEQAGELPAGPEREAGSDDV
jgi:hypothetical protein